MKKLKCWIKTMDTREGIQFRRRKDYRGVRIDTFKPSKYGYDVFINESDNYPLKSKHFKSKQPAISFANKYMKKHNKC